MLAIRFETAEVGSTAHEGTHVLYTDRTHPLGVSASAATEWAGIGLVRILILFGRGTAIRQVELRPSSGWTK